MAVKILVVDDSATMQKIMQMTFAGEEAEVVTVADGESGIAKAKEIVPDVVFADASLEGMDGYAISHAIKSTEALARTAVIMLGSQHTPYDAKRGAESGVDDHVAKPFDTQVLIDRVAQVLSKPRATTSVAAEPKVSASSAGAIPAAPAAPPVNTPRAEPAKGPAKGPVQAPAPSPGSRGPKRTVTFGATSEGPPAIAPRDVKVPSAPKKPAPARPQTSKLGGRPAAPRPAPVRAKPDIVPAVPAPPAPSAAAPAILSAAKEMRPRLEGLGLTKEQVEGVLALSREVVEQVVWEVVPDLAETIIREEIRRLTTE